MHILNFGHPITTAQQAQVVALLDVDAIEIRDVNTHFDHERPFAEQVTTLVNDLDLSAQAWQSDPILINPPAHNLIAVTLLAELHGRMGYFPAVIRLKPVPDTTPPRFEVAEIVNLQAVRDTARTHRFRSDSG